MLIFAASGAVKTLAVQFAKLRKARVLARASGRGAAMLVRELGTDAVIDARSEDATKRLRTIARDGIDAALALASGDALERCLDLARASGRAAYPSGVEPKPHRRPGVHLHAYDGEPGPRRFTRLERAATAARLRVPIAAVYPLAKASKAHVPLAEEHIRGGIAAMHEP